MAPFVDTLGYKFNTETEFVDEVLAAEIEILDRTGDLYCPCRVMTGDPKQDAKIVCPCIPFFRDEFAALGKCWCGLFILHDVADGADLIGVVKDLEPGADVDVPVARIGDIPDGFGRHVKVGKHDIAVFNLGGEFFALSNLCRHAYGPLAEGVTEDGFVMCPWHGWRYDVRDGTTDHPDADVRTYPTSTSGDVVSVRVSLGR
jgi:nitrite reductase/ring-hydroxylating ferredoxin subunit